jgi:hypothetical protein
VVDSPAKVSEDLLYSKLVSVIGVPGLLAKRLTTETANVILGLVPIIIYINDLIAR